MAGGSVSVPLSSWARWQKQRHFFGLNATTSEVGDEPMTRVVGWSVCTVLHALWWLAQWFWLLWFLETSVLSRTLGLLRLATADFGWLPGGHCLTWPWMGCLVDTAMPRLLGGYFSWWHSQHGAWDDGQILAETTQQTQVQLWSHQNLKKTHSRTQHGNERLQSLQEVLSHGPPSCHCRRPAMKRGMQQGNSYVEALCKENGQFHHQSKHHEISVRWLKFIRVDWCTGVLPFLNDTNSFWSTHFDQVQEVSQQGPLGKLCGSLCVSCLGVVMFLGVQTELNWTRWFWGSPTVQNGFAELNLRVPAWLC